MPAGPTITCTDKRLYSYICLCLKPPRFPPIPSPPCTPSWPRRRALLEGEHDRIANAANLSALVYQALPQLNWAGFYLYDGTELVLGPFQGKPACVRIPLNRGVCGAAASARAARGGRACVSRHIACDAASRSEIVVPLVRDGQLIGVWDVDSPVPDRFDADDQAGMEALCAIFLASLR